MREFWVVTGITVATLAAILGIFAGEAALIGLGAFIGGWALIAALVIVFLFDVALLYRIMNGGWRW